MANHTSQDVDEPLRREVFTMQLHMKVLAILNLNWAVLNLVVAIQPKVLAILNQVLAILK